MVFIGFGTFLLIVILLFFVSYIIAPSLTLTPMEENTPMKHKFLSKGIRITFSTLFIIGIVWISFGIVFEYLLQIRISYFHAVIIIFITAIIPLQVIIKKHRK